MYVVTFHNDAIDPMMHLVAAAATRIEALVDNGDDGSNQFEMDATWTRPVRPRVVQQRNIRFLRANLYAVS
jgi:hypothetical protein